MLADKSVLSKAVCVFGGLRDRNLARDRMNSTLSQVTLCKAVRSGIWPVYFHSTHSILFALHFFQFGFRELGIDCSGQGVHGDTIYISISLQAIECICRYRLSKHWDISYRCIEMHSGCDNPTRNGHVASTCRVHTRCLLGIDSRGCHAAILHFSVAWSWFVSLFQDVAI